MSQDSKVVIDRKFDGATIEISTPPPGCEGQGYRLMITSDDYPERYSCRVYLTQDDLTQLNRMFDMAEELSDDKPFGDVREDDNGD
jgi:hypothetical protein